MRYMSAQNARRKLWLYCVSLSVVSETEEQRANFAFFTD
jgi:hypothetical protein